MVMLRTLLALGAALLLAAPAGAAVAPGRVALPFGSGPDATVSPEAAGPAVALPDGGVVVAGAQRDADGLRLTRLRADGTPDPAFGDAGTRRVALPTSSPAQLLDLLRRPDGRMIVVTTGPQPRYQLAPLVLVGLTPEGALDPAFGESGVAALPVAGSCGGCTPVALTPDGKILVTGQTGSISPAIEHDSRAPADFRWVVVRLSAGGALDSTFGADGVATVPDAQAPPSLDTGGFGVAALPGGEVLAMGRRASGPLLLRLRPDGAPDPAYHDGTPLPLPGRFGFSMLARPDGSADVNVGALLIRVTPDGQLDPTFGAGGSATLGLSFASLLDDGAGGVLAYGPATYEPRAAGAPSVAVRRVDERGVVRVLDVPTGFGGGFAGFCCAQHRVVAQPALAQDSFVVTDMVRRPDRSLLTVGSTVVVQYSGEGEGRGSAQLAVAALRDDLSPDRSFGGPVVPATTSVELIPQRARTARVRRFARVRLTASGPGLTLVRVRDGRRRILFAGVVPVYAAGTSTVAVPITATGLRRPASPRAVQVGVAFRDVLGAEARGVAGGRLR
jgi:uncharacterized delta-60 repeat protein